MTVVIYVYKVYKESGVDILTTEEVGFEPTDAINVAGFQDHCHQPLDHSSSNNPFHFDKDVFVESKPDNLLPGLELTTGQYDNSISS